MKRRRHKLEVSTFPFLAVLLCAMGSLILLLLVIDRRAKAVARAKALQAAAMAEAEDARLVAARAAELERRRRALHALLLQQDQELLGQIKATSGKASEVARGFQQEQGRVQELRGHLEAEASKLTGRQAVLASRQAEVAKQSQLSEASRLELSRLTVQLQELEQTLAELKALRQRDQQTYSIIPYRGKRGDNRRPIYVECTAAGLVFHPEGTVIDRSEAIRSEVERRIGRQQADDKKDANAYLLMLVRPDGIGSYYATVSALSGLKVDFGYEFIESDWVLDFPANDAATPAQPWMTADRTKAPAPVGSRPTAGPPVKGLPGGRPPGFTDNTSAVATGKGSGAPGGGSARPQGTVFSATAPGGTGSGVALASPYAVNGAVVRPSPLAQGVPAGGVRGFTGGAPGAEGGNALSPGGIGLAPRNGVSGPRGTGSPFGSVGTAMGVGGAPGSDHAAFLPGVGQGMAETSGATGAGMGRGTGNGTSAPFAAAGQAAKSGAGGSGPAASGATAGKGVGTGTGGPSPGTASGAPAITARGNIESGASFGQSTAFGPSAGVAGPAGPASAGAPGTGNGSASATGQAAIAGRGATGGSQGAGQGSPTGSPGNSTPPPGQAGQGTPNGSPAAGASATAANAGGPAGAGAPGGGTNVAMGNAGGGGMAGGSGMAGGGGSPHGVTLGPVQEAGDGGEMSADDGHRGPLARLVPSVLARKPGRPAPLRARTLHINRDWPIPVDCKADGVVVRSNLQHFSLNELARPTDNPLLRSVQQLIARRQARVPDDEPPYRPMIEFRVHADGLRAFYLAYPVLALLNVPMTRQDLDPEEEVRSQKYGR
jgi:hypothetical protein